MTFPTSGFDTVSPTGILDEERFDAFRKGHYYPVNIGDVFHPRYQVLGFGVTTTVWLARDLEGHRYSTLKIYTREESHDDEFQVHKLLNRGRSPHPGYPHVRTALDTFTIPRPGSDHQCLVQKPMWESFRDLLYRNSTHRFTEDLLKAGLEQVFLALDFLHTECKLVHTDMKGDNILQEIADADILDSFIKAELESPSPRKSVNVVLTE
ncbi:kinase-like domain-containing protein [Aspergillus cavernicola]|uniref:non-specific serine/threonine protein kinase n=1 Tax=Aspergillus cavernicola TaxID=176166 RepID=A0ABR4J179_9EURO